MKKTTPKKTKVLSKKLDTKKKWVAVSGGFDPVHIGHVRLFQKARALGDALVVILNNDNWLLKKKGYVFMPQSERKEMLESIQYVDEVIYTVHKKDDADRSICRDLERIQPHVFANGGDRNSKNIPEIEVCERHGIKMVFGVGGGKRQSSSWLVDKVKKGKTS